MNKEAKCMKLAYWTGIVKEANSSGMKISEWCDINHISHRKYYYWHKKVMDETYSLAVESGLLPDAENKLSERKLPMVPEFAELTAPGTDVTHNHSNDPGISIQWNGFTITVNPDFSERELAKVLKVMRNV